VSFATVTLCVTSQRVFIIVVVYFVIHSVRKRLDTPSYLRMFLDSGRAHTFMLFFILFFIVEFIFK